MIWKKCSSCKKEISTNTKYYQCSVSTCQGERTGYVFCSIICWEVHLPGAKHRDAGAIEKQSPSNSQSANMPEIKAAMASDAPRRIIINSSSATAERQVNNHEVLVVVSKMKQYIKDMADMNTSEEVNATLSQLIRQELDQAILQAKADGRKTVMSRDFKKNKQ